jgi:hypothetical protein
VVDAGLESWTSKPRRLLGCEMHRDKRQRMRHGLAQYEEKLIHDADEAAHHSCSSTEETRTCSTAPPFGD